MPTLLPTGKQQFTNGAGVPLAGGKIYTFEAGTTTPKATYQDAGGAVQNTNPIILDARGEAQVFWDGVYDVKVTDSNGKLIYTTPGYSSKTDVNDVSYGDVQLGDLLKNSVSVVVSTIAALRNLDKKKYTQAIVAGYAASMDGGVGVYTFDAADVTSQDNGGTVIVALDGGRWKRQQLGNFVNVAWFGADPTGTADSTTAIRMAVDYLMGVGGTLFFPRGYYRVTGPIQVGLPYFSSFEFIVNRSGPLEDAVYDQNTIADNKTANTLKKKIDVIGESGAFLVADFSPATLTPVISYNLDNDGPDDTGSIRGLAIIAANQFSGGKFKRKPYASNKLIGIYIGRGSKINEKCFFAGLGVGMVAARAYWCSIRDMDATQCGDAFHFSDVNASHISNLNSVECTRAYIYNAQNAKFSCFNTENCDKDVLLLSADACVIGPAYLEDVRTSGGDGNYMMQLGRGQNGLNITHTTFHGILTLRMHGTSKKSFRMWSIANSSFLACRAYGGPIDVDTASNGTLVECDFPAPNATLVPVAKLVRGSWTPVLSDSAGHAFVPDTVVGEYSKVGNLVTAVCSYSWASIGAADGSPLILTGLPFPAKNIAALTQSATIGFMSGFDTGTTNQVLGEVSQPTLQYITFKRVNDNASPTPIPANAQSPTGALHLTITYLTD